MSDEIAAIVERARTAQRVIEFWSQEQVIFGDYWKAHGKNV